MISETSWKEERDSIQKVNPNLYDILESYHPTDKHTFIKLKLPFGFDIHKNGHAFFMDKNNTPISFTELDGHIKNQLSYSAVPLTLIMNKTIEIYIERSDEKTIPFKVFYPGETFGEWAIMPSPKIIPRQTWGWSARTGARTLFMPYKLSDSLSFHKIKEKYHLNSVMPDSLFKHGNVFSELAQNTQTGWQAELLLFSKKWFEDDKHNIGYARLKSYAAEQAWRQFHYWSNRMVINFSWEHYISELLNCKIKLNSYLLDTVKHLIAIGCGTIPGFKPTDDSQLIAPTKKIQEIYVNDYQLKSHLPIIMHPDLLDFNKSSDAVYYSLQLPTLPDNISKHSFPSTMKLVSELKLMMDVYLNLHKSWAFNENNLDLNDNIQYTYYHSDKDKYKSILSTKDIFKNDLSFEQQVKQYENRTFPETAPFFRGCVKIKTNNI